MKKTYHFLSGLPRSGSTVLAAILNQNPSVYVTPTSPLLDLLIANQDTWKSLPSVLANPFPEQLTNITRAMIDSAWQHRPEPIIIDKNRGWGGPNVQAVDILFEKDIKMINTVRDLPSIMASWLTLIRKNPNNHLDHVIRNQGFEPNDDNYMAEMWFNMVRDCMQGLQLTKQYAGHRSIFINYNDLMQNPKEELKRIESFLELPPFEYDLNHIVSTTVDDDLLAWGFQGMHSIRPKLQKISQHPKEVLGEDLYNRFLDLELQYQ